MTDCCLVGFQHLSSIAAAFFSYFLVTDIQGDTTGRLPPPDVQGIILLFFAENWFIFIPPHVELLQFCFRVASIFTHSSVISAASTTLLPVFSVCASAPPSGRFMQDLLQLFPYRCKPGSRPSGIICMYKVLRSGGGLRRPLRSLRKEKKCIKLCEVTEVHD